MTHVGHESQTRAWRSQTYHWYYPPRTYGMPCSTFKNISKSFSLHEFTVPLFQRGWFNVETLLRQLVLTLKLRKC